MIVDEGEIAILHRLLKDTSIDAEIGLFTNVIDIALDTVLGDLTEIGFPGYARIISSTLAWPVPTTNMDSEAESDGPLLTWEADDDPDEPIDATGIFVTIKNMADAEKLFMAYTFPDPITITASGDQVEKKINWFCTNY